MTEVKRLKRLRRSKRLRKNRNVLKAHRQYVYSIKRKEN